MAKYQVETFYTCTFKISHYLNNLNEQELENLEQKEDGKFEIIDLKIDNRKTKSLEKGLKPVNDNGVEEIHAWLLGFLSRKRGGGSPLRRHRPQKTASLSGVGSGPPSKGVLGTEGPQMAQTSRFPVILFRLLHRKREQMRIRNFLVATG